jgi:hypothetical protein
MQSHINQFLLDSLQFGNIKNAEASLSFIVQHDGQIIDVKILRNNNQISDAYWVYVFQKMPKWNPGMNGDQPVNVIWIQEASFSSAPSSSSSE